MISVGSCRGVATFAFLGVLGIAASFPIGCRGRSATARRDDDLATSEAEAKAKAQEVTITGAELAPRASEATAQAARDEEMTAAFRLEQSDYRGRLQMALDQLDRAILHSRSGDLRARRRLLKADLEAIDRCTEHDWATLRPKLERDLATEPYR
jgi:hypothetical protein